MELSFVQMKDMILTGGISLGATWLLYEVSKVRQSVQELNVKLAVILSQYDGIAERVERLENKIL